MMSGPRSNTRNQALAREMEDNGARNEMASLRRETPTIINHVR